MNMTPEKEVVNALDYKWDLITWVFSITLFSSVGRGARTADRGDHDLSRVSDLYGVERS